MLFRGLQLLCLAFGIAARADAKDIPTLITDLAHPDFATREQAQQQLLLGDPAALPLLNHTLSQTNDWEQKERIVAIITALQRRYTQQSYLMPKRISLKFNKTTLTEAVTILNREAKVEIQLGLGDNLGERTITLELNDMPVWEAIEAVRKAAKLVEQQELNFNQSKDWQANQALQSLQNARLKIQVRSSHTSTIYLGDSVPKITWIDPPHGATEPQQELSLDTRGAFRVAALPGRFELNRRIRGLGVSVIHLDVLGPSDLTWTFRERVNISKAWDETGRPIIASQFSKIESYSENPYANQVIFNGGGQVMFMSTSYYGPTPPSSLNTRYVAVPLRTDDRLVRKLPILEGTLTGELKQKDQPVLTLELLEEQVGKTYELTPEVQLVIQSYHLDQAENQLKIKVSVSAPSPWNRLNRMPLGVNFGAQAMRSIWDDGNFGCSNLKQFQFLDENDQRVNHGVVFASITTDNGQMQISELQILFKKTMMMNLPRKLIVVGEKVTPLEIPFRLSNVELQ